MENLTSERLFGLKPENSRWLLVAAGFAMNLCLGSVYTYSIFKPAVEKLFEASASHGNFPFMTFILCFSVTMFVGGFFIEKFGVRQMALAGSVLVGLGWMLSGFASNVWMLVLTYGVIAGSGVGLVYPCPIAVGARWFPDRQGLATGLMLAGFGGSAFLTGKIAIILIGDIHELLPEELAISLPNTFIIFGLAFTGALVLLSMLFTLPPKNWKPSGWRPKRVQATEKNFSVPEMLRTRKFWGLFVCFLAGSIAGLMAIGISKPVGSEVIKMTGTTAAGLVGIFALFNAVGRPLFGAITDRTSPRTAAAINFAVIFAMSVLMLFAKPESVTLYVAAFSGFWLCLGGWLAIAPTSTAVYFGVANHARNYGTLFLAYGIGAIVGGIISGQAKDVFGCYTFAFYPTALLALLGFFTAIRFLKEEPKKAD